MPASTGTRYPPNRSKCSCQGLVYLQAYFVTIATILGTGILGLPVTLMQSGLYPFLVTFLVDAVVQSLLVHLFVDILQRACVAQQQGYRVNSKEESVPLNAMLEDDIDLEDDDDDDDGEHTNGAIMKGKMLHIREPAPIEPPNLHLLGKLFLTCFVQQAFDALILLQFIALLICYALAGSEAFAELIDINHVYVIPFYTLILTLAIVFGLRMIQPIVSILTFFKGSLLLATTVVTFYVGVQVAENIQTDFKYTGAPFLMGTVALGGVVNTMPYTFEKIPFKKAAISKYRTAVQLGMWTCVALNILWCWAVLEIVPQTVEMACLKERHQGVISSMDFSNGSSSLLHTCHGEYSLESAKENGEISTLPLTKILQKEHPSFTWVAMLIEIFILVSITVSFLTIGSAFHHTLSGIVQSFKAQKYPAGGARSKAKSNMGRWFATTVLSLMSFALVFAVAMLDPKGFVIILEKLVSFSLNIEVGLFIFLMVIISRIKSYRHIEVPLPMKSCLVPFAFILPIFFNFAVVYDVYESIVDFLHPQSFNNTITWNITTTGNVSDVNATLLTTVTGSATTTLLSPTTANSTVNSMLNITTAFESTL